MEQAKQRGGGDTTDKIIHSSESGHDGLTQMFENLTREEKIELLKEWEAKHPDVFEKLSSTTDQANLDEEEQPDKGKESEPDVVPFHEYIENNKSSFEIIEASEIETATKSDRQTEICWSEVHKEEWGFISKMYGGKKYKDTEETHYRVVTDSNKNLIIIKIDLKSIKEIQELDNSGTKSEKLSAIRTKLDELFKKDFGAYNRWIENTTHNFLGYKDGESNRIKF